MAQVLVYLVAINALTYFLYWHDKQAARNGGWRVAEGALLLAGFLGGTAAAFAAQRIVRHKTRKWSFQFSFWTLTLIQIMVLFFLPEQMEIFLRRLG